MISLELLTFKDGNALGNMLHLFGINGDVLVGYAGEEEMALGKMEEELTYNSEDWIQSQPRNMIGNFSGILQEGGPYLGNENANSLKRILPMKIHSRKNWRMPPWRTLPTCPRSLPVLEVVPLHGRLSSGNSIFHKGSKCKLPHSKYNYFLWYKIVTSTCFSVQKNPLANHSFS